MSDGFRAPRQELVPPGTMDVHARDMTATIAADVSLRAVQEELGKAGQWVAVDGNPDTAVGNLVEINSTGPLRLGYGAWRDLLLGVQFRNGRGELITAGGRTMKNVAGYDLTKFMVGQRGEFGTIVTVTVRTYRRPEGAVVVELEPELKWVNELIPTAMRPQWMMMNSRSLWCGYLGDEKTLAYYEAGARQMGARNVARRSLEEDIAHRAEVFRGRHRIAVPPVSVMEFVRKEGIESWVADPAFGIVLYDGREIPVEIDPVEREVLTRLKQAFGRPA